LEFRYGYYNIYFSGGFSIENLDLLDIHLFNAKARETITLKEKSLKQREIINGEKSVWCFE
jgi:hypothetical protein